MWALKNFIFHQERDDLHTKIKVLLTPYQNTTQIFLCLHLSPDKENGHFLHIGNGWTRQFSITDLLCWASPLPLSITAQTTAVSGLSPSSSCKQYSFLQIPALGPAQAAVPDHSSQLNMLFGLNFLKTRKKNLGQYQINCLKFELETLTYTHILLLPDTVS